ncbi:RHS repeat-associated core domain-containing protein [Paenimyroides ummariense]|uniref:RHS repeat-associated core domain-containing protein n=1 Tax=Paenimyroides ummariense TaxID=913024 RepID=A0A1I5GWD7_9FLAO|nr:RHS repeat-associated core domain-containing protein [Paenimyroides ummariense]SFO39891.1 RHS repeat-associated core domain-containing protein [Paenimyroides ummariense]
MQTFPHAEGYVKNNGGNYVYHYIYKDHLGNNRLVYADLNNDGTINPATEIVVENNYYPFGLKHQGYNNLPGDGYKYKLNGKEYEDSFGLNIYEMDLRQYDPAIGRWTVMDPITHHEFSPYSAFDNNPVYWSDPSGADSETYVTIADLFNKAKSGVTSFEFENGQLVGESFAKTIETTLEQVYLFLDKPTDDTGGASSSGNGNGGGDPKKSIWMSLSKLVMSGYPSGNVKYDGNMLFGTNFIGPGPDVDPKTLGLEPKDMLDLAAFFHDISYYNAKVGGIDGALNSIEVLAADKKLASDAYKIIIGYWLGKTDPVTENRISPRTYNMAIAVYGAFAPISEIKSVRLETNMIINSYYQTILNSIKNNIRY